MTEQRKPDLRQIEPIGRAPDADDEPPGAMGVDDAEMHRQDVGHEGEPRTSPETEEQLDQLRRG